MAKKTLLDMVQGILSDIDGDEVNSISDTTEALQVADIIRDTYEAMVVSKYLPHLKTLMRLDATSSATPTTMKLPVDVMELLWIKYDKKASGATNTKFQDIEYLEPDDFIELVNGLDTDKTNVESYTDISSNVAIKCYNDRHPTYWTSFDDEHIVFDAYDSSMESNLQNSKTQVSGYREPSLSLTDTTIPDLPAEAFPLLISECTKRALGGVKQVSLTDTAYKEEDDRHKKQTTFLQRKKWRTHTQSKYPNYGRS